MYFFLANFCLLEFTLHHINVTLWQQVKFFFGVFNNPFQLKNNTFKRKLSAIKWGLLFGAEVLLGQLRI